MKKLIGTLCCLVVLVLGISVSATQITSEYVKTENEEQYYTTSGTISNAPNAFVTLLVTDTETITVDSIMYIDQGATDANGNFTFSEYIPKVNLVGGQQYVVRVGVWGTSAPIQCDPLIIPRDVSGYSVSGDFSFVGDRTLGEILVLQNNQVLKTLRTAAGVYTIYQLQPGDYVLQYQKQSHLPETKEITINDQDLVGQDASLAAGDATEDKIVNLLDIGAVLEVYNEESTDQNKTIDVNQDGYINVNDLTIMISNYGEDRRNG